MKAAVRLSAAERRKLRRQAQKSSPAQLPHQPSHTTRPNRTSCYDSVDQEAEARRTAVIEQAKLIRAQLPVLLQKLSQIPDPRNPVMVQHTLTTLMVYGILMFVLQTGSRRKSNETLSAPAMKDALMAVFPELASIPHQDTLWRLLKRIEPLNIEAAQVELVNSLVRNKKFSDYLVEGHYLIVFDGMQKLVRRQLVDTPWLQRQVGAEDNKWTQYYVYVLEANLVLSNGISIPLMSEFLDYSKGDSEREKQDCEQRAFFRLAKRLKVAFPHLPILLCLDGLFASGPVMSRCRQYKWHFLIVLQDGNLPYLWQEYDGLKCYRTDEQRLWLSWANRTQLFEWQNDIDYHWGHNGRNRMTLHMVHCQESWQQLDENGKLLPHSSTWAWAGDVPFSAQTIHARCNLGGRHRWSIEEGNLVEKQQGYNCEHLYAENWNAMRGYHYLMRIGHMLNVLSQFLSSLISFVKEKGPQGFIAWIRETLSGRWLQTTELRAQLCGSFQLRLLMPLPVWATAGP